MRRTPSSMSWVRSPVRSSTIGSCTTTLNRAPRVRWTDIGCSTPEERSARRVGPGAVWTVTPKNGAATPPLNF
jgi:hypothetical protein